MIKTLSPYTNDNTKTAEILSRYRPIAPKPVSAVDGSTNETPISSKIMQSPYLKNVWPQLQNKPTRTRKRGRGGLSLPPLKRARPTTTTTEFFSLSSPNNVFLKVGHVPSTLNFENPVSTTSELVTLPLLPCLNPSSSHVFGKQTSESSCMEPKIQPGIDLNAAVAEVSEEKDFLKLYHPGNNLVTPKPVRPVGSTICVGYISELVTNTLNLSPKKREEVEREVESEILPTVVSDSNNRVRLVNSAYKEMVGEPECSWLDALTATTCKRICGEVVIQLCDAEVPSASNGFSCWVRIEWGSKGSKKCVNTFCDVIKLSCDSNNYQFTWRFHARNVDGSIFCTTH